MLTEQITPPIVDVRFAIKKGAEIGHKNLGIRIKQVLKFQH
jgi:hypothetical protein